MASRMNKRGIQYLLARLVGSLHANLERKRHLCKFSTDHIATYRLEFVDVI